MYIKDGIAYAGEIPPVLKVCGVKPLDDYKLWLRFSTGETRIFDFKPLLQSPCFSPLSDINLFKGVYIDHGITTWNDEIDICPNTLYEQSRPID